MSTKRLALAFLSLIAWFLVVSPAQAGWPAGVKPLALSGGKASELGDVALGKKVDLAFAAKSEMACWPAPKNIHFDGNHVFYAVEIPAHSELTIVATPRDATADVSLYAYSLGTTRFDVPPTVPSAVACEASYGSTSIAEPYNPGKAETIKLVATTNPYNALIAVAGAQGAVKARFKLDVDLKTAAAAPTGVVSAATKITPKPGGSVKVAGSIDAGVQIALGWAANSSVACFPAPHNPHFDGNHVVYEFDLPAKTEVTIELVPKDPKLDLSLYAYQVGTKTVALPPAVTSAVACEASYGTKKLSEPYNPGGTEKVFLNSIANPYKIYVGVAGAQGIKKGSFELAVTMSAPPAAEPTGKVTQAKKIVAKANGSVTESGSIDGGPQIALGWAAQSSVACFPATQNAQFTGSHVVYQAELPPYSEMTITATPKDPKLDINLYAYQTGSEVLPPAVTSVVACEASYGTKKLSQPYNPGVAETVKLNAIKNGYKVYIGVAGAQGVTKGAFDLEIDLKVADAAPTGKISSATAIAAKPGETVKTAGKLDGGPQIALAWAADSSVACFPATKNDHFDGAHVLYKTSIPPKSVMKIRAIPKDPKLDVSLYAFMTNTQQLPPSVSSVLACEASYGTKKMSEPYNPGVTEETSLDTTTKGYDVYIGVAGAKKTLAGAFTLEVELSATPLAEPTGKITAATKIDVAKGASKAVTGSIDGGTQIALAWASNSSVACFPATKNEHFDGNHVLYTTDLPAQSILTATLKPKTADLDLSLYAFIGGDKLPPDVVSTVSCEASYGTKKMSEPYNPGQPETVSLTATTNPYKVYIGVAGVKKLTKGSFDLEVKIAPRP